MSSPIDDALAKAQQAKSLQVEIQAWMTKYGQTSVGSPNLEYQPPETHRELVADFLSRRPHFDGKEFYRVPAFPSAPHPYVMLDLTKGSTAARAANGTPLKSAWLYLTDSGRDGQTRVSVGLLENGMAVGRSQPQWGSTDDFASVCALHLVNKAPAKKTGLFGRRNR